MRSMGGSKGGTGVPYTKAIWFLSNTGPDPLKNHKAIKPAFNVGSNNTGPLLFF